MKNQNENQEQREKATAENDIPLNNNDVRMLLKRAILSAENGKSTNITNIVTVISGCKGLLAVEKAHITADDRTGMVRDYEFFGSYRKSKD